MPLSEPDLVTAGPDLLPGLPATPAPLLLLDCANATDEVISRDATTNATLSFDMSIFLRVFFHSGTFEQPAPDGLSRLLGHRRKILAAIATPADTVQAPRQPALTASKPQDTAERRQVTVMFSDLVGSTALSARMDPEDLREVISAYQKCVAETVQRFGGFVAKYMGDGVLVYFGYPQAHEDDAERAVRAGLELIEAVGALKSAVSLQTRVGIATGLVVVGDLIGSGEAQERGIVGETPNLGCAAARRSLTPTVVIAASTRQQIGDLFDLEDLGPKELAGLAEPQRAWTASCVKAAR